MPVEPADDHEPALGAGRVERRPVLDGEQRRVVPRRAGRAHDPRLAADRGERVERRLQIAGSAGGRLGARPRGPGEPERQRGGDARDGVAH